MNSAAASASPEHAIAGMLAVLRVMAERFVAAFGAPAALAVGGAVYGKTRERILRFLHDMECVVRRLLLLRAALFPAPAPRPIAVAIRGSARRRREGDAAALFGPGDDPAQWRVYFRMAAPPEPQWMLSGDLGGFRADEETYELGHRVEKAQEGGDARLAGIGYWADDPRPLAERFEALLRIIDDADHYAARLAQRLHQWRGRTERRQIFLRGLCAKTPVANEAGLQDEDWAHYGGAREMALALLPVFSSPAAPLSAPATTGPPPGAGA